MDFNRLWVVADRVRSQRRLPSADVVFVREVIPVELKSFPGLSLPKSIQHPAGFLISGAPVGTFLRSALLIAGGPEHSRWAINKALRHLGILARKLELMRKVGIYRHYFQDEFDLVGLGKCRHTEDWLKSSA